MDWYFWSQLFTLENAIIAAAWFTIIGVFIHIVVSAWRKVADSDAQRTVLRPDAEGRYPVVLLKNKRGFMSFDRERGWGIHQMGDDGSVTTFETPTQVLTAQENIEIARANANAMVPAEMTYTYSPADTYAPSNSREGTVVDNGGDGSGTLAEILDEAPPAQPLPNYINFFDRINEREPGNIIVGVDEQDALVQLPMMDMFHQLIGGMSGFGKSIYLRSLVFQLLLERENTNMIIGVADIEGNTFSEFKDKDGIEWYAGSYVEIQQMTSSLLKELEARKLLYEQFGTATPKDIQRYNTLARREGRPELPIIVALYDEFTALMNRATAVQKRIMADVYELALRARKYGIFLVFSGHSYKADVLDSTVIGQFGFNLCFRVRTVQTSLSVLGEPGAELITQPGEALMRSKQGDIRRIQALYLEEDELIAALDQFQSGSGDSIVPDLVKHVVRFAHTDLGDKVLFKQVEAYMASQHNVARNQLYEALRWMDEHNFVLRNDRNGRVLNLNNEHVARITVDRYTDGQ